MCFPGLALGVGPCVGCRPSRERGRRHADSRAPHRPRPSATSLLFSETPNPCRRRPARPPPSARALRATRHCCPAASGPVLAWLQTAARRSAQVRWPRGQAHRRRQRQAAATASQDGRRPPDCQCQRPHVSVLQSQFQLQLRILVIPHSHFLSSNVLELIPI